MYGLPKVHKPNSPLRPILSAINTAHYGIAKYLVPIIRPITENDYTLRDTFDFVNQLQTLQVPAGAVMASFDVTSLFTSLPLVEMVDLVTNDLFLHNPPDHISQAGFRKLLELAVFDSFFLFEGDMYHQIDGVAMGSPLGPTLANAFLCHYESIWLNQCPPSFKPIFYRRYVDDTFLLFKSEEHIQQFLVYLNACHKSIKFTVENAVDNSLPFLDVSVSKVRGKFETCMYRKKTFTGLYTWFDSFMPLQYKLSLVFCLLSRAYEICSSYEKVIAEFKVIQNILGKNGYPENVLSRCVKRFMDNKFRVKCAIHTVPKKICYVVLPFIGSQSLKIKKNVLNLIGSNYNQVEVHVVFRSISCLWHMFQVKEPVPGELRSCVIYKFKCSSCNATYFGKTKRHFSIRVAEHLGLSARTGKPLGCPPFSAVRNHRDSFQHVVSDGDFEIIQSAKNDYELCIFEGLLINRDNPSLNIIETGPEMLLFR